MYHLQLIFVCVLCLVEYCSGVRYSKMQCPRGYKCTIEDNCSLRLLQNTPGQRQYCGYTSGWKKRICCPLRVGRSPHLPVKPKSAPTQPSWWSDITPSTSDNGNDRPRFPTSRRGPRGRRPDNDNACPRDFRCVAFNQCPQSVLRSMNGRPRTCGHTDDWSAMICCPEQKREERNDPSWSPQTPASYPDRNCGKSNALVSRKGLVIGGEDAKEGEWPWMVAIKKKNPYGVLGYKCSGFLIDKQHLLSAAHCFDRRETRYYVAIVGHVDMNKGQEYRIRNIAIYPEFSPRGLYDDIAVVTLESPVHFPNFNPICLPWSRQFMNITGMGTTVAGWGITKHNGVHSQTLKHLSGLSVVSNYDCKLALREKSIKDVPRGITSGIICAGHGQDRNKDSCDGDSGGPLMFEHNDQWFAVGIVAFGYSCGTPGIPGGYTRVSEYLNWINEMRNNL